MNLIDGLRRAPQPHAHAVEFLSCPTPTPSKKRKALQDEEDEDAYSTIKKLCQTPTKDATLRLESPSLSSRSKPLDPGSTTKSNIPATGMSHTHTRLSRHQSYHDEGHAEGPPDAVQELVDLNSSFLTALSLHYTHNDSASPVSLVDLTSAVTQAWRKRTVSVDDIRRTLGVMQRSLSTAEPAAALKSQHFYLADYGRRGVCLERRESRQQHGKRTNRVIHQIVNYQALKLLFESEIHMCWMEYYRRATSGSKGLSAPDFVAQLPLADVTILQPPSHNTPGANKGRRRLQELMGDAQHGQAAAKPGPGRARTVTNTPAHNAVDNDSPSRPSASSATTSSRNASLLDRILAKQTTVAAGTAGLTQEKRIYLAAIDRCEFLFNIINMNAVTQNQNQPKQRMSILLSRLTKQFMDTYGRHISTDDVKNAVNALGSENILPNYVHIAPCGSGEAVVVNPGQNVGLGELIKRIANARKAVTSI